MPTTTALGGSRDASSNPADGIPPGLGASGSTAEASIIGPVARDHGLPVVPQGALTGLAGCANAVEGAGLLNRSPMNAMLRVDTVDQVAVVQPGVVTDDLDSVAAALNARPRKTLRRKTPAEALNDHLLSIHQTGVATTS